MKKYLNNRVLIIPDTHAPYHHRDTISFLSSVADKYNPDRVFHIGDWVDSYCFSRYPKDIEHPDSFKDEYKGVRRFSKEVLNLFPEGVMMKGNHDARLWERSRIVGVPKGLIVPFEEIIGIADSKWKTAWDYTFTVEADKNQWFLAHTKTATALRTAQAIGMSTAFGHNHTKFLIDTFQTPYKRLYGVNVGCLIGNDRYAFAYNRASMVRPNRGCVMILNGIPKLIPFDENTKGRWNKKLNE